MHPFIMEAGTQGKVLRGCLDEYFSRRNEALEQTVEALRNRNCNKIIFSGMGSSYYAPFAVTGYLTQHGIPAIVINAAELANDQLNLIDGQTLLVVVSQSGESPEVVELLKSAGGRTTVVGIVNNDRSFLAMHADIQLQIYAGYEKDISNKSYLNTLAVLNILAARLTGGLDETFQDQMYAVADWVGKYLESAGEKRKRIMEFLSGTFVFDFIGNGAACSTACEAGLIFREGPRYATFATTCAEYSHGWNLLAGKGSTAVIFDPFGRKDSYEERMKEFVLQNKGRVIVITSEGEDAIGESVLTITHPKVPARMASLAQIIPCTTIMGWLLEVSGHDH
jgi:glucosamine--fructose-6-phosphate aminotransferase (isomerizing)